LVEFKADKNEIEKITNYTFQGSPSLTSLSLNNNRIGKIEYAAFAGLKFLEILTLSFNRIHFLKNSTFRELSSLKRVDLSHNKIAVLVDGLFMDSPNIQEIYLQSNEILAISGPLITEHQNLKTINLFDNICVSSNLKSRDEITRENYASFEKCVEAYEILRAKNESDPEDPEEPVIPDDTPVENSYLLFILIGFASMTILVMGLIGTLHYRRRLRELQELVFSYDDQYGSESPYSSYSSRRYSMCSLQDLPTTSYCHITESVARSYEACIKNSDKLRKNLNFKIIGQLKMKSGYEEI
jgi:netrin-G2